jgi:hypothetical protein
MGLSISEAVVYVDRLSVACFKTESLVNLSFASSGFHSAGKGEGGYTFNAEQQQQIPSRQNEEDTRYVMEAQNHI